ncbi:MAG: glucose 1-dehydrogenase [Alicyclobacillus sp.]|nr:glucose 1-dehydrogenase [Alicyclobacillus sp.]
MRLQGKVAIVTGAGRNIGAEVARQCAREGARVAVVDNHEGRASAVADEINSQFPDHALAVVCDVSSKDSVQAMVDRVLAAWGQVDILVNNVAITDRKTVLELDVEEWNRVLAVTLTGTFLCSKYAAQAMVERGTRGRIVNIASTSGHRGRLRATAYTAAKAGVLNFTRTLAAQLAPYGIRVNSVTPNKIGSPVGEEEERKTGEVKNLIGRNGRPLDIAHAVVFMVSDEADFITGVDLLVDGGVLAALDA